MATLAVLAKAAIRKAAKAGVNLAKNNRGTIASAVGSLAASTLLAFKSRLQNEYSNWREKVKNSDDPEAAKKIWDVKSNRIKASLLGRFDLIRQQVDEYNDSDDIGGRLDDLETRTNQIITGARLKGMPEDQVTALEKYRDSLVSKIRAHEPNEVFDPTGVIAPTALALLTDKDDRAAIDFANAVEKKAIEKEKAEQEKADEAAKHAESDSAFDALHKFKNRKDLLKYISKLSSERILDMLENFREGTSKTKLRKKDLQNRLAFRGVDFNE